ncbi:hypothetical protein EDM56_28720 [Brevibacillus fluminis]|uniref:Transporter n=2 Tax=Brevibacillus fluminis TaxID=511487 RepID=A0A3M8CV01_9BACL|nr:hypothetical protein EDM56_28720 [Brevibacillus fluminis]
MTYNRPPFPPGGGGGGSQMFPPGGSQMFPPGGSQMYPPGGSQMYPPGGSQMYPPGGSQMFPPSSQGGQHQHGGPAGPPPHRTPQRPQNQLYRVDPGAIAGCLHRYTYVWLDNGSHFWFYPTFVGRTSVSGFRWRGHSWMYFGIDLNRIEAFTCHY